MSRYSSDKQSGPVRISKFTIELPSVWSDSIDGMEEFKIWAFSSVMLASNRSRIDDESIFLIDINT